MNIFDKNLLGDLGRALSSWSSGLGVVWHQHWLAIVAETRVLWTSTISRWILASQDVPTTMTFLHPVVSCGLVANKSKNSHYLWIWVVVLPLPWSQICYIPIIKQWHVVFLLWPQPRLCLSALLNAKPGAFTALMAIVCSSWCAINMGTSGRHVAHPLGFDRDYVLQANLMAARSIVCRNRGYLFC